MAQAARLNLRLQKELKLLLSDPPPGVSFPILSDCESSSSSLKTLEARIEGPEGTVYSEGVFNLTIKIPERYPFQPPIVTFTTPIYHPNIDNGGRICLDILNLPPKGAWQPSLNIWTVLRSICLLLSEPNPDDGLMAETSREYKYNRQVFDQKAQSLTKRYAGACKSEGSAASQGKTSMMVAETAETKSQNASSENESLKRPRIVDKNPPGRVNNDDKEDVAPTRRLSLSSFQMPLVSATSAMPKLGRIHSGAKPYDDDVNRASNKNKNPVDGTPNILETAVISDSEGSDDEGEMLSRSRALLRRKQVSEKWNGECS